MSKLTTAVLLVVFCVCFSQQALAAGAGDAPPQVVYRVLKCEEPYIVVMVEPGLAPPYHEQIYYARDMGEKPQDELQRLLLSVGNAITLAVKQSNFALLRIKGKSEQGSHGPNSIFWVENAQEFVGQVRSTLAGYYRQKGIKARDATSSQLACRMANPN